MTNLIYIQMKPIEQKICFQGIPNVFFLLRLWVFATLIEFWHSFFNINQSKIYFCEV